MIKYVIFDLDGVLIDSMKRHIRIWINAFKLFKIKTTYHEIALLEGMNFEDTVDTICKKNNVKLTKADKSRMHLFKIREIKKFKDKVYHIKRALEKLKKTGKTIAVVSGGDRYFVDNETHNNFNHITEVIISGDDVRHSKPNPQCYNIAVKALKAKKSECIVIENAPLGIEAAKKAGLKVLALTTTLPKKYLTKADKVFTTHKALFNYILTQ